MYIQLIQAKTSNIILNTNDDNEHSCLVSDLKGEFQCFTVKYNICCLFFVISFNRLRKFPSTFNLPRVFGNKLVLNFI